ncbi:ATP-binding cassette domain-containing protein [Saccharomonospora cyanea]|uniref:ABC-type multidrug transport system, ATPase component n=1 Tax=Saccharomonospora cyanea NA-134 TaxID=882082 RepID=H5XPG5_9PSEU|nr:ABC transporter ATP-binding protein [Saccharomonospora cyanea]EHR58999.1 ABC-type multidrug transport system, ATPase component [Saccharomonospora cyanea NA-134]
MRRLVAVSKRYLRGSAVLDRVDLDLPPGEVVGVLGANGSGKSTLLRIAAGMVRPSSGRVSGRVVVGYLPDRFPADLRLSALGYLEHMGRIGGLSTRVARRRAGELMERLALVGGPRTPLRELSKGNAQKVGLAQALLTEPDLLVLDEPFSGLDGPAHGLVTEVVTETRRRGAAVLVTEHRPDRVTGLATRVFRLADGRLNPVDVESGRRGTGSAHIVLTGSSVDEWRDGDIVLSVATEGVEPRNRLTLTVSDAHCDTVLLRALRRGASVQRVERRTSG